MSERISLFDELKSGGYESCLLTTFNVDFPFYEEVLLRRMRSVGIVHHLLLVDHTMCVQAINDRPPFMAGQHYSLAPMACGGAFHPKLLLLLGKDKGLLAVGSHNVTLSGFGQNLEITNVSRFNRKTNTETLPLFQAAYQACLTWLSDYGDDLPSDIQESLLKVRHLCPWLDTERRPQPEDQRLLFSSSSTESLWTQLRPAIPENVTRLSGFSAFFDSSLGFLRELTQLGAAQFYLGVQPRQVQAPQALLDDKGVTVVDSSVLLAKPEARQYIHAKALCVESEESSLLVSGSANLSAPAWLLSGEKANAEAIVVRSDDGVADAMSAMGINKLATALPVESLAEHKPVEQDTSGVHRAFLIVAYDEQGEVRIPLQPIWNGEITIAYANAVEGWKQIPARHEANVVIVEASLIKPGELIVVLHDGEPVAQVLLHNIRQIQQYGTTGVERKMRQALGSLGTKTPEINLLFDCIDSLTMSAPVKSKKLAGSAGGENKSSEESAPDTLLTDFSERNVDKITGRSKLSTEGDIGLIMDVLIHTMRSALGNAEQGLNEDSQGRNEEALIDSDDDEVQVATEQEGDKAKVSELCRKKFAKTVNRLDQYLSECGKEGAAAALGVLVMCQQLTLHQGDDQWVSNESLESLFSTLCKYLLDDKDTFYQRQSEDDVCSSDDWGRLLGYLTWLAYHADIAMRQRLPLSATRELKDKLRWSNACWLYLAQRLANDDLAREVASQLIYTTGDVKVRQWFEALKRFTSDDELACAEGFGLARSPKGAFSGCRLVVERDQKVSLASIAGPGDVSQFGADYLDIMGVVK